MLEVTDMRKKVLEVIKRYDTSHVEIVGNFLDDGYLVLETAQYKLKITINAKWVGYDFSITKDMTGGVSIGAANDTDLYPLDFNEEVTSGIFQNVLEFIDDLLSNKFYYGKIDKKWVFAHPSHEIDKTAWGGRNGEIDEYLVSFFSAGLFGKGIFSSIKTEAWTCEEVQQNGHIVQLMSNE